ncbi:hypothetical protein BJX70DRAFT_403384 [Aspergillus crustosus]
MPEWTPFCVRTGQRHDGNECNICGTLDPAQVVNVKAENPVKYEQGIGPDDVKRALPVLPALPVPPTEQVFPSTPVLVIFYNLAVRRDQYGFETSKIHEIERVLYDLPHVAINSFTQLIEGYLLPNSWDVQPEPGSVYRFAGEVDTKKHKKTYLPVAADMPQSAESILVYFPYCMEYERDVINVVICTPAVFVQRRGW